MKYVQVLIFTVQSQLFETPNSLNKLIVVLNSLGLLQSDFYLLFLEQNYVSLYVYQ